VLKNSVACFTNGGQISTDRQMVDVTSGRRTAISRFLASSLTLIEFPAQTIVGYLDRAV
jgi:hypothetical protein